MRTVLRLGGDACSVVDRLREATNEYALPCFYLVCMHCIRRKLAVSLLDEMLDLGAPPDMVTFASAMLACDRAGRWHQVLRLMDQVQHGNHWACGDP